MKVVVVGATGLVGSKLLSRLVELEHFENIMAPVRRPLNIIHPTLRAPVVDFNKLEQYPELFNADILFFCFGTTLKKAGGIKEFIEIEKYISEKILLIAKKGGVKSVFLISAMGANSKSFVLYNKIKGEIEAFAQSLKFESLYIFRPSLLLGERAEKRFLEKIAQIVISPLMFLDQYFPLLMPISAETVVDAMLKLVRHPKNGRHIIENDAIKVLSR